MSPALIELPPVPGDPAGMRALAAALRADAAGVGETATAVRGRVDSLEFYGPAADAIEQRIARSSKACALVAERLLFVAAALERGASEVEAAQRERLRKLEELRREAARAAAGAP
jgi:hypothetical protein